MLVATITTSKAYFFSQYSGGAGPWWDIGFYHFSSALIWSLLTPLLFLFFRSYALDGQRWKFNLVLAMLLGVAVAPIHRFTAIWLDFATRKLIGILNVPISEVLDTVRLVIVSSSFDSLLTFAVIMGAYYGWDYYRRFRDNRLLNVQLKAELAQAHLINLKTQLHPHFLFNTMQAISTLMHRDVDLAQKAMDDLSHLLRNSFETINDQKIRLNEELNFITKYLQLQELRYQNRLGVEYDCPENLGHLMVPTLILQPLVENAIKHGIEPFAQGGQIRIAMSIEGKMLSLVVVNTVVKAKDQMHLGVGLSNTMQRIENLYQDSGTLEIVNEKEGVFEVKVIIPIEQAA